MENLLEIINTIGNYPLTNTIVGALVGMLIAFFSIKTSNSILKSRDINRTMENIHDAILNLIKFLDAEKNLIDFHEENQDLLLNFEEAHHHEQEAYQVQKNNLNSERSSKDLTFIIIENTFIIKKYGYYFPKQKVLLEKINDIANKVKFYIHSGDMDILSQEIVDFKQYLNELNFEVETRLKKWYKFQD